jgi:hypothetical protein
MVGTQKGADRRHCYRLKLPIAAAALALVAGVATPVASAADFWLQGRYNAWTVKRSCDAHGGQFHMRGGLRYRCELTDGKAVECNEGGECRGHVASSSALLPPQQRTVQGFLGAAPAPKAGHQ